MPKCIIDGREAEFQPGQNLVEVAKSVGVEVPVFCYHPGLSIVAQCRMCAVEVEKMGKLQTACSTAATDGMVVHTQSEKVKKNQKGVMEFLLINHPLDCPICDKAGECDLQDNSFKYGDAYMRYTEERRTYLDLDMGPVIKKNMNRCIHCTRCIRFGAEVAGIREMVAVQRGNNTEITTVDGRPLDTDYAGNYADICPTGSLTLKDFRFKKRAWYLKKTPTICEGCSKGCNIELQQENNVLHRTLPRENQQINKWWMCDEGRFNFRYVNAPDRITTPQIRHENSDWASAVEAARTAVAGKKLTILVGSDLTQEEIGLIQQMASKSFPGAPLFHFGTSGVKSVESDGDADQLLKRKSKTANLHGAEKLGLKGFESLPAGIDAVLIFRGGRAVLPSLKGVSTIVGVGVFNKAQSEMLSTVLPGVTFAEKNGTVINSQGQEQSFKRAILPVGKSKSLSEIVMLWNFQGTGTQAGQGQAMSATAGGA